MSTTNDSYKGKAKGFGPWRRDWYSICSRHGQHREDCRLCAVGEWRNRWITWAGNIVYILAPCVWKRWVNRPASAARKFLEGAFPGLKGPGAE
jgi:hypothetical protein